MKKVAAKHERISVDNLSTFDSFHRFRRSESSGISKLRSGDVNKLGPINHVDVEYPIESPMMMSAHWLSQSSAAIDSRCSGWSDGMTESHNAVLADQKDKSLPSSSIQTPSVFLSCNQTTTSSSSSSPSSSFNYTSCSTAINKHQQIATVRTPSCQSIDNQKHRDTDETTTTISSEDPPEEKLTKLVLNERGNLFGLNKRSNCLSFILALIVLCLSAQSNNNDHSILSSTLDSNQKLQDFIQHEQQYRSTNYPETLYNSITNLAQEFLFKQTPRIIFAEAQYKPEWPSKTLQQEIFLLNLEDGYFGCQVNESQDFLQLFELSRLCDGQTQCYLGTDEMAAPLKCNNRERCSTYQNSRGQQESIQCVNGVCLDGLCYCNDGFGGKSCDVPDENECKFRPCDVFAHCTNTMGSYYCSCFPGKLQSSFKL